jgi:flagellar biosynthesis/type III secretory pathway M-ring protein FliF/YscJ
VETTVGFDERRGDSIAIYSSIYVDSKRVSGGSVEEAAVIERNETPMKSMVSEEAGTSNTFNISGYKIEFSAVFYAFCFVVFMFFLLVIVFLRKKSNDSPRKLSEEERENVLIHLQHWLGEEKHE